MTYESRSLDLDHVDVTARQETLTACQGQPVLVQLPLVPSYALNDNKIICIAHFSYHPGERSTRRKPSPFNTSSVVVSKVCSPWARFTCCSPALPTLAISSS